MADNERIELSIAGMSCQHCVQTVKAGLGKLPGAKTVEVDLQAGTATITGAGIDVAAGIEIVERLGFSAGVIGENV